MVEGGVKRFDVVVSLLMVRGRESKEVQGRWEG
jgi:hypothetical protein